MKCEKCEVGYSFYGGHECSPIWVVCSRDDFFFEAAPGTDPYPDATYRARTREGAAEQWAKKENENGDYPLSHGDTPIVAVWEKGQDKGTATFFKCAAEMFTTYSAAECGAEEPD